MPEGDLGALSVVKEPPDITKDCSRANIGTDNHIPEKKPAANKRFIALPRGSSHNIMVRRVKGQSSGRQTIGYQVDPEKLHGNQSFRHTKGGSEENRHNLTNVR